MFGFFPLQAEVCRELFRKYGQTYSLQGSSGLPAGGYSLTDSKRIQDLRQRYAPGISLTNELFIWPLLRDRMLVEAKAHPNRYVVSTGLQQSLELAFAGAPGVVMIDAHGESISAFMQLAELATQHETKETFFQAARELLRITASRFAPAPIKSYLLPEATVGSFLRVLEVYGSEAYNSFRQTAILGRLRALHENVGNKGWGERVRQLTDNYAPSAIYLSNILDSLEYRPQANLGRSLYHLSLDRNRERHFFWQRPSEIVFGSQIFHTSILEQNDHMFSFHAARPWNFSETGLSRRIGNQRIPAIQPPKDSGSSLAKPGEFVQIVHRLTGSVARGLIVAVEDDGMITINHPTGLKIPAFYHLELHEIRPWVDLPPQFKTFQSLVGNRAQIEFDTATGQRDLLFRRLLGIRIAGGGFIARYQVQNPKTGEVSEIEIDTARRRILAN
jgi:hypothetical protein